MIQTNMCTCSRLNALVITLPCAQPLQCLVNVLHVATAYTVTEDFTIIDVVQFH